MGTHYFRDLSLPRGGQSWMVSLRGLQPRAGLERTPLADTSPPPR